MLTDDVSRETVYCLRDVEMPQQTLKPKTFFKCVSAQSVHVKIQAMGMMSSGQSQVIYSNIQ